MTEVYPIEANGGSAREVRAIHRKGSITSAQRVCARRRRWRRRGAGNASSPPGHAEDEGVLPLDVRGLRLAAHGGELPREEVDRPGEPLVDLVGGPYAPELAVHAPSADCAFMSA